ncbi:MAG: hypothetical protein ACRYG2_30200, partial [Janthinobacterium lividum]
MSTPAAARPRRFPVWAVALVVVVALVLVAGAVGLATGLGATSAKRAVTKACGTAVTDRLGTGTTDIDLDRYPPLVDRESGSDRDGTFHVSGEVDFTRAGAPDRGYYDCEVRRS